MHISRLRGQSGETKDFKFFKLGIKHPFPFLRPWKEKGGFLDRGYNTSSITIKNNLLINIPVKSDVQKNNISMTKNWLHGKYRNKRELSSAKLSILSWGWVELRLSCSWNWVETELGKYFNSSFEVIEVFNWSIQSLVPCTTFLVGWMGGWDS